VPSGGPDEEVVAELSEPVRAALGRAVDLALELATGIIAGFSGPDGSTGAADARAGEAAEAAQPEFDHI